MNTVCRFYSAAVARAAMFVAIASVVVVSANAAEVGKVAFVVGGAHFENSPTVQLEKRQPVNNGDTVVTGEKGRVQLRMIDGGKIAVRPDSIFKIENYAVVASATETATAVATSLQGEGNSAVLNLLKGGFRTITGEAAQQSPQSYQVKTPVATMGIRGTHYQVRLCDAQCASQLPAGDSYRGPGLYVGVYEGSVWVENDNGRLEIAAGEFVWVSSLEAAPALLLSPSAVLIDDAPPPQRREGRRSRQPKESFDEEDSGESGNAETKQLQADNTRRRPQSGPPERNPAGTSNGDIADPDLPPTGDGGQPITDGGEPPLRRSVSWSFGPSDINGEPATAIRADNTTNSSAVDNNGNLVRFTGQVSNAAGAVQPASFQLGTATVNNTGNDVATGLRWGRWSDGVANVNVNGSVQQQDLTDQSLHWITSPLSNQAPAIPTTGTANYDLVGNTNPTDNVGQTGLLGSASLEANFTTQTITNSINLGIAGENWQAVGSAALNSADPHLFAGSYDSVTVNGDEASGAFSGFLLPVDPAVNADLPVGAGLNYSLTDPNNARGGQAGVTVSGSAAFGNPQ